MSLPQSRNQTIPEPLQRLTTALADRYRIERELGQGGMATVYLAEDLRHHRKVAIKVLRPELAAVIGAERFLSEIRTTANLQHPHILALHDSGEADSFLYYVMPFIEGESLRDRLHREKQLPIGDAVRIAGEVAGALDYAHRHGIIHRDIKPENILLHDGRALVADFGIALAATSAGSRMTETGMSLGTPHYMSPEQAMGDRELTPRSDIYALGAMTYEMLLGEPPFTGPTAQSIVAKVMTEKPVPLIARRERIPPQVEDAVLTALEKLPADRFGSAAQFAEALTEDAKARRREGARPARPWLRDWRSLAAIGVAMAAIVFAAALASRRTGGSSGASPIEWRGELLGGPRVAMNPRVSPDGQLVAFSAMVDGQTQVGVLRPETGDWKVLTTDRTRGLTGDFAWSADNSKIYYSRFFEVPKGIYSISPLGTGERLVLADAGNPSVLPDGSLLIARVNATRHLQMYRYWPGSGKLDTLPAMGTLAAATDAFFQAFPDGREAAFFGRPVAEQDSPDHLYAIDLTTLRIRRLAPDHNIPASPLAMSPDGQSVVVNYSIGNENRLVAVPRDGSSRLQVLTVLTGGINGLDVDRDGNLYFDQGLRSVDLRRFTPGSRFTESWPILPIYTSAASGSSVSGGSILPLPDGRVLQPVSSTGGHRIVVSKPGGESQPFMSVEQQNSLPMAVLGQDRVALMLGADTSAVVALVSLATGQIDKELPGIHPSAMAGSPDGKTLYYVQSKVVWAIAAEGGTGRKIREGDAVAVDPDGRHLVVELVDKAAVRLFRVALDGGPEVEIEIQGDLRLAPAFMAPNAIAPDGRIALTVISPASWYWPMAILDPRTGKLEILPPGLAYDMYGGWDSQGNIVYYAQGQESSLWRFRPVTAKGRTP